MRALWKACVLCASKTLLCLRAGLAGIQTITTLAAGRRAPQAGNRPPSAAPTPAPALGSSTRTAGMPSQRRTASGISTGCARTCSAPAQQQLRSGIFFLKRPTTQMHSRLGASSLGFARRRRRPCRASKPAPDPRTRGWACPVAVICRTCASMARIACAALPWKSERRHNLKRERLHLRGPVLDAVDIAQGDLDGEPEQRGWVLVARGALGQGEDGAGAVDVESVDGHSRG